MCGKIPLGTSFPMNLETWSSGFYGVVRGVKLPTNTWDIRPTKAELEAVPYACRYGDASFAAKRGVKIYPAIAAKLRHWPWTGSAGMGRARAGKRLS